MEKNNLTLGSLFSGSGTFEFAAELAGITPKFNSEVSPFPIRVTTKRFPNVIPLGDVSKANGKDIPPHTRPSALDGSPFGAEQCHSFGAGHPARI